MGSLSTGGGSSAVAASAHAGCERFRHTDPLVIGTTRRALASQLGHPDVSGGIPEARWMRAMTFESLIRSDRFVSQLLTTAVGRLGLARPAGVRRVDGKVTVTGTAGAIQQAHLKATHENVATMITGLAVPFVGMEAAGGATPVKPDFAIVAPRQEDPAADSPRTIGSWLIMGDAKDYERVRSRIDDQRMLKGFLQVALGAESAVTWSALPKGMDVHRWGALAVPRSAFLQPEAVVELLDDHRREVRARVDERTALLDQLAGGGSVTDLAAFTAHLERDYDPARCTTCSLFGFCRDEVRKSPEPTTLLVEIGIPAEQRAPLAGLVDGSGQIGRAGATERAVVEATLSGLPVLSGQRRTDPIGGTGTVEVVLAKADAAALGVHGISTRVVDRRGTPTAWSTTVFDEPQAPTTRRSVMRLLGERLEEARAELRERDRILIGDVFVTDTYRSPDPVHIVVPDGATADLLSSIADSLAGVELSRLRWQRDLDEGRPALTFDGEPATLPEPLTDLERLAVSFLLEEDRARAMVLRCPIVNAHAVLRAHVTPGGPLSDAGRLDYLVTWAEAGAPLDHRTVSDAIADSPHTPGARMSNQQSDAIHRARAESRRGRTAYRQPVSQELAYKADVLDRASKVLSTIDVSRLRDAHLKLEAAAQAVWCRRLDLHASDLVRFSRTTRPWRNDQVDMLDADSTCATQLLAVGNPHYASDLATDAGTREVAHAVVVSVNPLRLRVQSRRLVETSKIVLLHVNGEAVIEESVKTIKVQGGSIKLGKCHLGPVTLCDEPTDVHGIEKSWPEYEWSPRAARPFDVGDRLVVADIAWFGKPFTSGHEIAIARPSLDTSSAPKDTCHEGSYAADPKAHTWCCRSHEAAEAEYSDLLAERRARGELNPQAWPPLVDEDRFEPPQGADEPLIPVGQGPAGNLTLDDLD